MYILRTFAPKLRIGIVVRNNDSLRKPNFASITGMGAFVPDTIRSNSDLEKITETSDAWIVQRTGIKERRILEEGLATSDMIVKAIESMLEEYPKSLDQLDAIFVATSTPDMLMPSTANIVCGKLGLDGIMAIDVNAACAGFLHVLDLGAAWIESGRAKNVLIVGADKISAYVNIFDRSTNILFGDGAGVVWLEASEEEGLMDTILMGNGKGVDFLNIEAGGSLHPYTEEVLKSNKRHIKQDGKVVFKQAIQSMGDACLSVLKRNNLSVPDVSWLVPHQANKRIIDAVGDKIGMHAGKTMINIEKYGNTIAATIPLCLFEHRHLLKRGDLLMFTAFGAGFSWGASLLKWTI